jgi:hypothetical protein
MVTAVSRDEFGAYPRSHVMMDGILWLVLGMLVCMGVMCAVVMGGAGFLWRRHSSKPGSEGRASPDRR